MSIQSDLNQILAIKQSIHSSIQAKGVSIPDSTPFSDYPSKIDDIGGGTSYPYNKFSSNFDIQPDSVSFMSTNIQDDVLPDYSIITDYEKQYCLMPSNTLYHKIPVLSKEASIINIRGLSVVDGIASGFSRTSTGARYLQLQGVDWQGTWEIQISLTTSSDISTTQAIIGQTVNNNHCPQLEIDQNKFWLGLSYSGSSWNISEYSSLTIEPNTDYVVKIKFDGEKYQLIVDDTVFITVNSSTPMFSDINEFIALGMDTGNFPFFGSINLNNSHIIVNGVTKWSYPLLVYRDIYGCIGYTDDGSAKSENAYIVQDKIILSDSTPSGGLKLASLTVPAHSLYSYTSTSTFDTVNLIGNVSNTNGVLSNFSTNSYAECKSHFIPGNRPWEVCVKFMCTDFSNSFVFSLGGTAYKGVILNLTSNKGYASWWISNVNANPQRGKIPLSTNTVYWAKIKFTGTQYIAKISTDGIHWQDDYTVDSTQYIVAGNIPTLGTAEAPNNQTFNGEIYLQDSYFKIGDNTVWSGIDYNVTWTKL